MLDGAGSFVPQVRKYTGPIEDASLGARQLKSRRSELAFGVTHAPHPGSI
jgi:hypothetical protein